MKHQVTRSQRPSWLRALPSPGAPNNPGTPSRTGLVAFGLAAAVLLGGTVCSSEIESQALSGSNGTGRAELSGSIRPIGHRRAAPPAYPSEQNEQEALVRPIGASRRGSTGIGHLTNTKVSHLANPQIPPMADVS
jgi:hypothetical protein